MRKENKPKLIAKILLVVALVLAILQWTGGISLAGVIAIIACLFSAGFLFFTRQPANLILLLFSTILTYFVVEVLFYFVLQNKFEKFNLSQKTFYSANSVRADTLAGYRWQPNSSVRTIRYIHGVKVYDNVFETNNMGYVAPFPFVKEKPADVTRIVWLGDSFSQGIFLDKSYPNRIHEMFGRDGKKVEIYNFSMDGGGITNWYRVFFNEILKLDFDHLVIASYQDDLDRDLAVFHAFPDGLYFLRTPVTTTTSLSYSQLEKLAHEKKTSKVADLVDENASYEDKKIPFGLYIYKYLDSRFTAKFNPVKKAPKQVVVEKDSGLLPALKPFEEKHGTEKMRELSEIMDTCARMNKRVLLISIPDIMMLQNLHETKYAAKNEHQKEIAAMATIFNCSYFDGYDVFKEMSFEDIMKNAWLRYDGHWGQNGSDIFAGKLYSYLNSDSLFIKK